MTRTETILILHRWIIRRKIFQPLLSPPRFLPFQAWEGEAVISSAERHSSAMHFPNGPCTKVTVSAAGQGTAQTANRGGQTPAGAFEARPPPRQKFRLDVCQTVAPPPHLPQDYNRFFKHVLGTTIRRSLLIVHRKNRYYVKVWRVLERLATFGVPLTR